MIRRTQMQRGVSFAIWLAFTACDTTPDRAAYVETAAEPLDPVHKWIENGAQDD